MAERLLALFMRTCTVMHAQNVIAFNMQQHAKSLLPHREDSLAQFCCGQVDPKGELMRRRC